jgi:hypothetical protein
MNTWYEQLHGVVDRFYTAMHSKSHDVIERAANYVVGGTGIGLSLVEATSYFQFIAAFAGAILVVRQLWRDIKKNKK